MDEEDQGRCINCGFLGRRVCHPPGLTAPATVPAYYEVDEYQREGGYVWEQVQNHLTGKIRTERFCFVDAARIMDETRELQKTVPHDRAAVVEVFNKDQKCLSWYRYNHGLDPKDHFNQMSTQLLEQSRPEFEQRLERERKEFDLKLFEISQNIQKDSNAIVERSDSFNRRMTVYFIILAVLEVSATVASLVFPNGIPYLVALFSK